MAQPVTAPTSAADPRAAPPDASAGDILRRLGPAAVLGLLAMVLPVIGLVLLGWNRVAAAEWLRALPMGPVAYAAVFAALAGLALMPTHVQAILGGYVFRLATGSWAAMLGVVGASIIGYEIAARVSGERAEHVLDQKPKWKAVRDALVGGRAGRGFWRTTGFVALIRLPPNSPFALTNLVLASTHVPRPAFILGTAVGMAPRTIIAVACGAALGDITGEDAIKAAMPWWFWPAGIAVAAAAFAVICWFAAKAVKRATVAPADGNPRPG